MLKLTKFSAQALVFLSIAVLGISCNKEDTDDMVAPSQNVQVNDWILKNMKTYYLWTEEIPANPNKEQDPQDFFKSLLSTKDRFSFITPNYDELIKSLQGVTLEAGYEFSLARVSESSQDVWAFILYVKEDSPAKQAGLKRGDIVTHINNQQITVSNYRELLGLISSNHSITYQRYNAATESLEQQPVLALNTVELAENPHFIDTVYTLESGKNVGYYVYNFFSPGTGNTNAYDQQMDNIIAKFKSKGVNELVLDLRYNSGGAVSSAKNLASLIGKNVSSANIFYQNRWNKEVQDYIEKRSDADQILRGKFIDKSMNIGNDLASGTVYILTDFRTASASELIINGLKPYMNVVLIGGTTRGKNVGSIPLEDEENEDNTWGMLPIVFQISNSQGSSDYADGFEPNIEVSDISIPMIALGNVEEPLLATAIAFIEGDSGAKIARDKPMRTKRFTPIGSSLERKAWSNRAIMEDVPADLLNSF